MLNSLNQYLGDYTGRWLPNSLLELKTNVSNNVKTCSKICSLFLNSSFGVGVAMGVVGLVTTSFCAGEDVLPIITSTILPFTTDIPTNDTSTTEMAFLCFKDVMQNISINGHIGSASSYMEGICNKSVLMLDCGAFLNDTTINSSHLEPQCIDFGSNRFFGYKYFSDGSYDETIEYPSLNIYKADRSDTSGNYKLKILVQSVQCLLENVFYVVNVTAAQVVSFSDIQLGSCTSCNRSNAIHDCFEDSRLSGYVVEKNQNITEQCLVPLPDPLSTVASVTASVLSDSCDGCNTMQVVFCVGSAVVLVGTLAKVIYQQPKVQRFNNFRASSSRLRQAATVLCNDGLLLGASGLGSGVILEALRYPCGSVDGSINKLVLTSTVMYGMSAASSLVKALTCREVDPEDSEDEEPIIELDPMLDEEVELGVMGAMV